MPKLSEVATFNRKSLLNNYSELFNDPDFQGASIIEYPGDDYVKAASLAWCAMRALAMREADDNRLDGNNNRPGHVLHNATLSDIIDLLWPTLAVNYKSRVTQGINKVFKASGCALNVGRSQTKGQRGATFDWWVADVWSINPKFTLKASAREYKPRKKEPEPEPEMFVEPPAIKIELPTEASTPEEPSDLATEQSGSVSESPIVVDDAAEVPDCSFTIADTSEWPEWMLDQVSLFTTGVTTLVRENNQLRKQVKNLEYRISTIRKSIMGDL